MRNNINKGTTKIGYSLQMISPTSDQACIQNCVEVSERKSSPTLPVSVGRTDLQVLQVSLSARLVSAECGLSVLSPFQEEAASSISKASR